MAGSTSIMRPLIESISNCPAPEQLAGPISRREGTVLLRTQSFDTPHARYSLLVTDPFLTFRSAGTRCEIRTESGIQRLFGNPWNLLDALLSRCELLDEWDHPFPLGGCFGFWGYDLKNFVEPKLRRRAVTDLELPDCHVGFYDSVVVFDHRLATAHIIATGLAADGSRDENRARLALQVWRERFQSVGSGCGAGSGGSPDCRASIPAAKRDFSTSLSRSEFVQRVQRARDYIRSGDIYQVNLSQRLSTSWNSSAWDLYERLSGVSPAPFAAYLQTGDFQIVSSSPELFLRLSGSEILTRPIKGTRPRSADPTTDAQLTYELQTSPKEMAELVMITDLLRNDLGRVSEFGSVQVPELVRLERYPQVQHLVSTVEGRLRPEISHYAALASCFPGGSITGAPKFRAMEIIDELEPISRGPYTGCIGYLGFNRESQLNIAIRTAVCLGNQVHFHAGAGIVADSNPEFEYEETLAKAAGFLRAVSAGAAAVPVRSVQTDFITPDANR